MDRANFSQIDKEKYQPMNLKQPLGIRTLLRDYAQLLTLAGAVILLDQLSKAWVRANLAYGEVFLPDFWLTQYVRIIHWQNTGAAFGMLQKFGNVFMVLSFVVSIAILYYYPHVPRRDWYLRLAMSLQLGGAVGNLIDRLTVGHVTDFISVGSFAVFNVADASISCGVAILILGMWWNDWREKKAARAASQALDRETSGSPEASLASETPTGDQASSTTQDPVPSVIEDQKGE